MKLQNIDWIKYKKQMILSLIILIIILFSGIYLVHASSMPKEEEQEQEIVKEKVVEIQSEETNIEKILVDIKGAVVNPGVYQLTVGCSVQDAINMAGGLLENANTKVINLSKRLVDEMVIIIYTNEEINAYQQENEVITEFVYVEIPCECPDQMNDVCINTTDKNEKTEEKNDTLISINTATKEELMTLTGIGSSKAEAIIAYRTEHGEFKQIKDIMNVSGIGESAFEKIKNQITI